MRYLSYIISFVLLFISTACVDDDLLPGCGQENEGGDGIYTLTFDIGVPPMDADGAPKSRAIFYGNPTYYEDWINTQDGLRVLFFITKREKTGSKYVQGKYEDGNNLVVVDPVNPLKDYFLFESTSRWASQLPYDDDNNLRYRVTVPVYQIGDEESEYREYWKQIRDLLRTYDFKVAILANHPDNNVLWTIKNSILMAPDIDDLSKAGDNLRTINDIHHSMANSNYVSTSGNRKDAYAMLVDNKHLMDGTATMGPFIDWVTARSSLYGDALGGTFTTEDEARTWIRDYWRPQLIYNEDTDPDVDYTTLYHNYRHIWLYWNFGGAAPDNGLPYSTKSTRNPYINEWETRNGSLLRDWITTAEANGGKLTDLNTNSNGSSKNDGTMGLTFKPSAAKAVITSGSNGKRFYGVRLPKQASAPSSTSVNDCFFCKINAEGKVVVRYVNNGGTIAVRYGSTTASVTNTNVTYNGLSMTEALFTVPVNDEPLQVYIYATNGEATVYDIEVTQDRYVYLTDREGILPSSDHPIPMYGVQKFDKLDGFWDEGASFDLTNGGSDDNGNTYNAKTIFLLRAVAKIELLIPKSLGVPKHVYLHSLNRFVRCEPMDLAVPTEELWKDHETECEWRMIQERGPMYNSSGAYVADEYKKKLAWYFGNWLEWGWDFNGYTQYKPDYAKDGPFPRLFNPYIGRADCAAFIDVTEYYNDHYYHYLFYMGENTIDAPSAYNGAGSSPMVPRIELRFDDRYAATSKIAPNTDLNLMGNDCYRIFFCEGGIASGARDANGASKISKTGYNSYYTNSTYMKEHWPIIRNHIYRFTVIDTGVDNMSGLVVNAQDRSVDFNFK